MPRHVVGCQPHSLGDICLFGHHGRLRERGEDGLCERRISFGNQIVDAHLRVLRKARGRRIPGLDQLDPYVERPEFMGELSGKPSMAILLAV